MKLWLDDIRPAPEGWLWVKTAEDAIQVLETGLVTQASLDHDLGLVPGTLIKRATGIKVTDFMAEYDIWPSEGVNVHSANPVAAAAMRATIKRYGGYQ